MQNTRKNRAASVPLRTALSLSIAALGLSLSAVAAASPFKGGTVTLVVPSSAGSSFDNATRSLAEGLAKKWDVPVVVNNRPGAATIVASSAAAKAAPDGRTILLMVTPSIQAPFLHANLDYDPVESFAPVAQMFDARLWLGTSGAVDAKTVKTFMSKAREARPPFKYASPGNGSTPHLSGALLAQAEKLDMLHVPFKGVTPAIVAVGSNVVESTFASYSDLLPHAQSGKLRILASTGASRSELTPDIPTMAESGYPGFELLGFGGLVVPAGTPAALVEAISRDVLEILAQPDIKARYATLGFELNRQGPDAFGKLLKEQSRDWKKLMDELKIDIQ
ncbi:MAG: tripartite tricarboxylate transporter substrate-binding protein [Pigmentiphaga sp.]